MDYFPSNWEIIVCQETGTPCCVSGQGVHWKLGCSWVVRITDSQGDWRRRNWQTAGRQSWEGATRKNVSNRREGHRAAADWKIHRFHPLLSGGAVVVHVKTGDELGCDGVSFGIKGKKGQIGGLCLCVCKPAWTYFIIHRSVLLFLWLGQTNYEKFGFVDDWWNTNTTDLTWQCLFSPLWVRISIGRAKLWGDLEPVKE